jgi:cysteine desulfurase
MLYTEISRDIIVAMIYLDNNATTPVDPEVSDAVFSSLRRDLGNPSSVHLPGRKANEAVEFSRKYVADLLNCSVEEICFTSGGTESNNLAIIGTAMLHKKGHIITSAIEHPSVVNTCLYLESLGFEVTYAPVNSEGMVEVESIKESIRKETILISIMHSNNETGVIQPIEEIGAVAKERGITFHVDAAQSIGKMHFNPDPPVNLLTIVSHKFYGPKGVGALYVRNGTHLKPIIFGAGHERGLRPGTENVAGIVGLGKACQIAKRDIKLRVAHTTALRDLILHQLKSALPDLTLNGHRTQRLSNTLNMRVPGVLSSELVELLKDRVAVSTGSACHAGKMKPSIVLKNMGLSDEEALSSIRLSVGKDNTEDEIKEAVQIIVSAVQELRKESA